MNKKGFILTFDLLIGLILVFIVILFSVFFMARSSQFSLSEHNNILVGADVVRVLDQQKVFDSFDHSSIEQNMLNYLPGNLDMLIRMEGNFSTANGTIEVGADLSSEASSGQQVGITDDGVYFKVTYFIWEKEG